ncbi:hypothetical protein FVP74_03090 [Microbacterium saccharophilum]|uniref:Uncharacterized protein n=1 Tax=Microbacterium saccharophilum TaxID=1213358 RepID=A0A5C8I7B4_9MICO|nr:hypothetical protein [Microbacterium saccharophilum]TXK15396.1 hypothetical protein FVP74_03090 [Microbacterium saccharophilum]GEP47103.1 hypothetical protein MSA03_06110 [Microbacterium saccharophilum]
MRDDDAFAPSAAVTVAEKPAGLSRRQLLRAGAWAAPALVLATAAPAAAASVDTQPGGTGGWEQSTISTWASTSGMWDGAAGFTRVTGVYGGAYPEVRYDGVNVGLITYAILTISIPKAGMRAEVPTVGANSPGWKAESATTVGGHILYKFSWTGSISTTGNRQFPLTYTLPGDGSNAAGISFPKPLSFSLISPQIANIGVGAASAPAP